MELYNLFETWLNNILSKKLPDNIIAFNFNLYENTNNTFSIELVGCDEFDSKDDDWACSAIFSTMENLFTTSNSSIDTWEKCLGEATLLVKKYLSTGEYSSTLKSSRGVGVGFVDGDLDILYMK